MFREDQHQQTCTKYYMLDGNRYKSQFLTKNLPLRGGMFTHNTETDSSTIDGNEILVQ